jgi:hypothetical protein
MGRIARVDEVADRAAESPPSDVRVAPRAAGPDTAVSTPSTPAPPLPQVDGVVIAGERRLAIVAGIIVAPGDRVGQRLVARIVRDGVVLREPSGEEIHVAIRTRKAGS